MALRLRRGTNAERATRVFDLAEPVWVTDKQQLWIGNGTGSVDPIQSYAGTGLTYSYNTTNGGRLSVNLGALNTDQLPQGGTNKYFSNQQAQDAFAELLSNGTQTGISFTYNPIEHSLNVSVGVDAFLVSTDTDPSLGGDLDLDTNDIVGQGNIDIEGDIENIGKLTVTNGLKSIKIEDTSIRCMTEELVLAGGAAVGGQVTVHMRPSVTTGGSILTGLTSVNSLDLKSFKNGSTAPDPGNIASGDILGVVGFTGVMHSTLSAISSGFGLQADPGGTLTSSHIPGKFFFVAQPDVFGGTPKLLTFDSKGRLAINQENASATLDINGFAKLAILNAAPASPANGMIAIASGTGWNPLSIPGKQQMVVYLGGGWREMAVEP